MNLKWTRVAAFLTALVLCLSAAAAALADYDTIPYGAQGNKVRKMQAKLKEKGMYSGSVDGTFGPSTKAAVVKFQKSVGITADGKPGNKTLTALYEGKKAINKANNTELKHSTQPQNPHTLYYGCTGSRVKELQRALKKAGVYKGSVDGVYGDATYAAVKAYQREKGLTADGMAGVKTLNSLYKTTGEKVKSSFVLDIGSKGSEVKSVARYLNKKGYLVDSDLINDTYDKALSNAVKDWQSATGKEVTGAVTEKQYNEMILD